MLDDPCYPLPPQMWYVGIPPPPPPPPPSSFSLPSLHAHKHSHTATEYHLGLLKAKLAKYRSQLLEPSKSAGAGKVRGRYVCELELLERKSLLIRN